MKQSVKTMWQAYLDSLPDRTIAEKKGFQAWGFGDSPDMADRLGALVKRGIKTATSGSLWHYELDNEPIPQVGDLSIITDGNNEAMCIIETIEAVVTPFNEVDASIAYDEGEGDRTLAYWRRVHEDFFRRTFAGTKLEFSETIPLVCERFQVVFGGSDE
jgi:uncharacterized protein YhfF